MKTKAKRQKKKRGQKTKPPKAEKKNRAALIIRASRGY